MKGSPGPDIVLPGGAVRGGAGAGSAGTGRKRVVVSDGGCAAGPPRPTKA
ncbi:hypothetical protein [Streptomyces sp. NPDC127119]